MREGVIKQSVSVLILILLCCNAVSAADKAPEAAPKKTEAPPTAAIPANPSPAAADSDSEKDWKSLQAQEQWVTRLKKQIDGEIRQLSEMRGKLAEKYKLDPKKLEAGRYVYDEEKNTFSER